MTRCRFFQNWATVDAGGIFFQFKLHPSGLAFCEGVYYNDRSVFDFPAFSPIQGDDENMTVHKRIEAKNVADITIAVCKDMKLNDDLVIQEWGEELLALLDNKSCRKLLINFERVLFMSSSALRSLIQLNKKVKDCSAMLFLCGIDDNIMEAFRITRLDTIFTIKKNEDDGIRSFTTVSDK